MVDEGEQSRGARRRARDAPGFRRMIWTAKRNRGSLAAVVVLIVLGAIALFAARDTDQYVGNVMLNVGASFIGAIVTYALVNPLMSRADRDAEKILDHFDYASMILNVKASKDIVRIFDTGVALLADAYRERFTEELEQAIKRGVKVEILLLDPDCLAAEQRAAELGSALDVRSLISQNLQHLHKLYDNLKESDKPKFDVRVYDTAPLAQYYRWDQRAMVSFYPSDRSSADTTQYQTSVDSNFAQFVEQRFHESWTEPSTYTLQQVFALPIKITTNATDLQALEADWVQRGERIYLAHHELTSYALESGLGQLQVHLDHRPYFVGVHRLTLCDAASPVHQYFEVKYGPGPKRTVLEVRAEGPG